MPRPPPGTAVPDISNATAAGNEVFVPFDRQLDSNFVPPLGAFTVRDESGPISVVDVRIDSVTLTLATPVMPGEERSIGYEPPQNPDQQLRDIQGNPVDEFNLTITTTITTTAAPFDSAALRRAALRDHIDIVQALIDAGAMLDIRSSVGSTALHLAVSRGHIDIVRVLLGAGADATITNNNGQTAHDVAMGTAIQVLLDAATTTTAAPTTTMP